MFKKILLSVVLMCSLFCRAQKFCDKNGDPVNPRGGDVGVLATGCCCDFSWKTPSTSPPLGPSSAARFQLTADSLFINVTTVNGQNMDTVLYRLNQRKGSTMTFVYITNSNVFAEVELEYGSGVDMGSWWKFAIDYLDYPIINWPLLADKPFCATWEYGTSSTAPDGFIPLAGTDPGSPCGGDIQMANGTGIYTLQDSLDAGIFFTPSQLSLYCNDSPYGTSLLLGTVDLQITCTDTASIGMNYANYPAFVADNTVIWRKYLEDYLDSLYLPLLGGTMLGDVEFDGSEIRKIKSDCGSVEREIIFDDECGIQIKVNDGSGSSSTVQLSAAQITISSTDTTVPSSTEFVLTPFNAGINVATTSDDGFEYNSLPANMSDETMVPYGYFRPIHSNSNPSSAPQFEGQHWVNDTTGDLYYSIGTTSTSDWRLIP